MAKVKLDLQKKTDEALNAFAAHHAAAMVENENFPAPDPPASDFDPDLVRFSKKLEAITTAESLLQTLRSERDELREKLETRLGQRAGYVDKASGGNEAKILSAAFEVKSAATSISSLPAPVQVSATMGDNPGEIDLSCHTVPRAKTYIVEAREHSDTAAPGPWSHAKLSVRSSMTIPGLPSGHRWSFRISALGPHNLESPWSAEVTCMVP